MASQVFDVSQYTFNPYAIPTFVISIAILLLGSLVLISERVSRVSALFFILTLTISIWLFSFSVMYSSLDEHAALWWGKAGYLGVCLIPAAVYHFTLSILRIEHKFRMLPWFTWILSVCFTVLFLGTEFMIKSMYRYSWGYYPKFEWPATLFVIFFFVLMLAIFRHFWVEYHKAGPGSHKLRIKAFSIAFSIGYLGSFDYLGVYGLPIYPFGYIAVFGFLILAARAIWRFRLIDLSPAFAASQILETMGGGVLVVDLGGKIRVVNRAVCQMLRYQESEILEKPISTLNGSFKELFPGFQNLMIHQTIHDHEMVLVTRYGDPVNVSISASQVMNHTNEPVGIVYVISDITERKRGEEKLRKSEARFSGILDIAHEAIISIDENRRIVIFNKGAEQIFGYSGPEALGMPLEILLPSRFQEIHKSHIDQFSKSTMTARRMRERGEIYGRRKNGEEFPAEASISKLELGEDKIFTVVLRDATDRKMAEETLRNAHNDLEERVHERTIELEKANEVLKKMDQMKSDFISMVSHEVRTPLTSIKNSVDLLKSGSTGVLNDKQEKFLGMAARNINRLAKMINDVLDFSKIEAGKLKFSFAEVDLSNVVKNVFETFKPEAELNSLVFQLDCPSALPKVYADPERMEQVLCNFVSNALKFTPKRGRITISAREDQGSIRIGVEDTGIGMSEKEREKVFERFYQAGDPLTRTSMGTGIGLSISKQLIDSQGGRIFVESHAGKGSCFYFKLPCYSPELAETITLENKIRPYQGYPCFSLLFLQLFRTNSSNISVTETDGTHPLLARMIRTTRKVLRRGTDHIFIQTILNRLIIVLPETPKPGAHVVKEILEAALQEEPLFRNDKTEFAPVLFGPVAYPEDGTTFKSLLSKAQEMFHLQKVRLL